MNKLRFTSLLKVFVLMIALAFISLKTINAQTYTSKETGEKLLTALHYIKTFYVDTVNESSIVEKAIINMLKELDPHSVYISKEDLEKAEEGLKGNFEGIGVTFQIHSDTIHVISPVSGGPSEKAGIHAGDMIVKINDEDATGEKVDNKFVFDRLRGKKGTEVNVSIKRKTNKDLLDFTIIRDKIPILSLDASYMLSPETGYIKLNRFSATSMKEYREAMKKLSEQGMQNLVLDLRNNSGGYMHTAIELSDEFLGTQKLIVYTEGVSSPKMEYKSTARGSFKKGKLVLIINEGSASASEIVSGAVQDWDRGIVIGRRSFGKALVQKPFPLPDGSIIRLTTAKYYTPSGRSIQKPYENGIEDYYKDFSRRAQNGELVNADSIHFPDSLKYFTSKHRTVFGGGGIMPDVFIPWDSTIISDYYTKLIRKGILSNYIIDYIDDNREDLNEHYPDIDLFIKDFSVEENILEGLTKYATEEGLTKTEEVNPKAMEFQIQQTKALIARNLYGVNAYFRIMNEIDEECNKALEIINDNTLFRKLSVSSKQ
ncbi:MAG: S41 family peptidase [Bacteroidales bacterium]|nr:S41 family peptidase [Bacteroidales bacterium]